MLPLEMPPDCVPWCGACPCGFFCQAIAALNFERLECQVFDAGTVLTGLTLHMFKLNNVYNVVCMGRIAISLCGDAFVFSIVHFRSRGTCLSFCGKMFAVPMFDGLTTGTIYYNQIAVTPRDTKLVV